MTKSRLLVMAAGGTGGHMFPAQALAEEMLAAGWRVKLFTDRRGARYVDGFPEAVEVNVVDSANFARGGLAGRLLAPFRLMRGVLAAAWRMLRDRPDVVVGFGGYPAFPAMAAAWLLRIPRMIHEQNGILGRVNRLFARHVDVVACGTWPTALPPGVRGIETGNPVRSAVLARDSAEYIAPGDYPMSLLVIGGSQGAHVLAEVVPAAIALLPEHILRNLRISQQARPEDLDFVRDQYAQMGLSADVAPFFDDIPARLVDAQLVISRAGASSLADITVIGRPAILIPLAASIKGEQAANAQALAQAGAAEVIAEPELTALGLARRIESLLGDAAAATAMARAAKKAARPEATQTLTLLVEELALGLRRDEESNT